MESRFLYMPVFRGRLEETKVLTGFEFGRQIIPCVEIIKGLGREPAKRKKPVANPKPVKTFEEVYIPLLSSVKSEKIFVDMPVHMVQKRNTKKPVLKFLRGVADRIEIRTEYMLKFAPIADRIIPVISTYWKRRSMPGSILKQESDLRGTFHSICYRTFLDTFEQDMPQIIKIAQKQDFLIVDLQDNLADPSEPDLVHLLDNLSNFKTCPIIILRSSISNTITNIGLNHGQEISEINNCLLTNYKSLHGTGFGDYAGIKKDDVTDGGGISPGFIYFDPVSNSYYGFKGSGKKDLTDFETIIVPAVLRCIATNKMLQSGRKYLSGQNKGWQLLLAINKKSEKGKSQGKFKRISMEHYVHCIKTKIIAGDFN